MRMHQEGLVPCGRWRQACHREVSMVWTWEHVTRSPSRFLIVGVPTCCCCRRQPAIHLEGSLFSRDRTQRQPRRMRGSGTMGQRDEVTVYAGEKPCYSTTSGSTPGEAACCHISWRWVRGFATHWLQGSGAVEAHRPSRTHALLPRQANLGYSRQTSDKP